MRGGTPRARLTAAELAKQLVADPGGELTSSAEHSETFEALSRLNRNLDDAELDLLAVALEHGGDVRIAYRDKRGVVTIRVIQPEQIYDRWLESWCYLRDAEREFAVANIESVGPAR